MPRLIWSPQALLDVQRLRRALVERDAGAASRAVGAIRQQVKILAHQPAIGRPVAEMDPAFREWLVAFGDSGYVVQYRHSGDLVLITAVRHQKEVGYS